MNRHTQRLGALALVLSLIAAPVFSTAAEAGRGRHRGEKTRSYCPPPRHHRVRHEPPRRHHDDGRYRDRHRGHHRDSGIWPFVGGVVVGTVLGSQFDTPVRCETRRPVVRARIYIYDCDACDYQNVGYEAYCDHLVFEHNVSRCDVTRWYRPYEHGYWEDQY